jgi:hypothetical protein
MKDSGEKVNFMAKALKLYLMEQYLTEIGKREDQ